MMGNTRTVVVAAQDLLKGSSGCGLLCDGGNDDYQTESDDRWV